LNKLDFIYQDEEIFCVNKPAGLHSVALSEGGGPSVAALLLDQDPSLKNVSLKELDAGLVHRLDLSTSGALLGAKTRRAWEKLHHELNNGQVEKEYLILCEGIFEDTRTYQSWIGSDARRAKKVKSYEIKPKSSDRFLYGKTEFSPEFIDKVHNVSLIRAKSSLARRHQVRIHAASLGHPLVGDALYGATSQFKVVLANLGALIGEDRDFFLHAIRLSFNHPSKTEKIDIVAESEIYNRIKS